MKASFCIICILIIYTGYTQNVGIGTNTPKSSLHIFNGGDASLATPSGYLMIGNPGLTSIVMDDNEILARNAGGTSPIYINNEGGDIYLGAAGNSNVGIATINPLERLHLASGNIRLDNALSGINLNAADRPLITRRFDAFTSGNYNGLGRWGLFMEPSAITIGVPNIANKGFAISGYNANSTINKQLFKVGYDNTGTKTVAQVNGDLIVNGLTQADNDLLVKGNIQADMNINVAGKVTRSVKTGSANMTAIAYGLVNANGDLRNSSGNITVIKSGPGAFRLVVDGYSNSGEEFVVAAIPYSDNGNPGICFASGGKPYPLPTFKPGIEVWLFKPDGNPPTSIGFSFVIYHPNAL